MARRDFPVERSAVSVYTNPVVEEDFRCNRKAKSKIRGGFY
jgi:hypothetical protein